jgi:hypothetical protein
MEWAVLRAGQPPVRRRLEDFFNVTPLDGAGSVRVGPFAVDLVVHEANLPPLHTPYEMLAGLPADLHAKLRLIHYPDDFDPGPARPNPCGKGAGMRSDAAWALTPRPRRAWPRRGCCAGRAAAS